MEIPLKSLSIVEAGDELPGSLLWRPVWQPGPPILIFGPENDRGYLYMDGKAPSSDNFNVSHLQRNMGHYLKGPKPHLMVTAQSALSSAVRPTPGAAFLWKDVSGLVGQNQSMFAFISLAGELVTPNMQETLFFNAWKLIVEVEGSDPFTVFEKSK